MHGDVRPARRHRRHRASAGRRAGRVGQARTQGSRHPRPEDPRRPGPGGGVHRRTHRSVSMTATIGRAPEAPGTKISGLGYYRPSRSVSNDELSETMETNDEWIRTRVGIQHRRWAGPEETVVSMGADASRGALAEAGLTPADIDTVIVATCSMQS